MSPERFVNCSPERSNDAKYPHKQRRFEASQTFTLKNQMPSRRRLESVLSKDIGEVLADLYAQQKPFVEPRSRNGNRAFIQH